jgi:5S rRNA maturation endonuclease (ribonuclease M5)
MTEENIENDEESSEDHLASGFIREYLESRLEDVLAHKLDHKNIQHETSIRAILYKVQRDFKNKYGLSQLDFKSKGKLLPPRSIEYHQRISKVISRFADKKLKEFQKIGIVELKKMYPKFPYWGDDLFMHWSIFRRKCLCISAKQRAISYGYSGEFPVLQKNREKLVSEALFTILCEKETMGLKVLDLLEKAGYKCNLVVTQGFSVGDLIEAVIHMNEKQDNFYVLVLHDLDYGGFTIYKDVKQYFPNKTFSIGLDLPFLEYTYQKFPTFDHTYTMEEYNNARNKKYLLESQEIKEWIEGINKKYFNYYKNRIELVDDPDLVRYIVDYVINFIEETLPKFNINRISYDVRDPSLDLISDYAFGYYSVELARLINEWIHRKDLDTVINEAKKFRTALKKQFRHFHKRLDAGKGYERDIKVVEKLMQYVVDNDEEVQAKREEVKPLHELGDAIFEEAIRRFELIALLHTLFGLPKRLERNMGASNILLLFQMFFSLFSADDGDDGFVIEEDVSKW